ncbi:hypothetical protein SAMN04487996_12531 [Dyadobacter soli]|uniref:Uncharacterized protein n=1 Tax=Dyadobacter soli TaxID=659014 RepID=A0A1G7Y1Z7_9BACT|nr:hypothetical protein SAMN04487996_12531 [Dyadobacter soli]
MKTNLSKCVAFLFLILLSVSFSCNRENSISPDPDGGAVGTNKW